MSATPQEPLSGQDVPFVTEDDTTADTAKTVVKAVIDEVPGDAWMPPPPPAAPVAATAAYQPPQPQQLTVVPRSAVGPVIASLFFPGVGSMMNGKTAKGVLILLAAIISIPLIFAFGLGILTSIIVRIYACVTANTDTQEWNKAHGFLT